MRPSELSNRSSTIALPTGLRPDEPEKITSVSASPRRRLAALSPMTQRIASMMFDLPQPFGPTMPDMLVGKCSVVGSTNDLNPASLIVVKRMETEASDAPRARASIRSTDVAPAPRRAAGAENYAGRGFSGAAALGASDRRRLAGGDARGPSRPASILL